MSAINMKKTGIRIQEYAGNYGYSVKYIQEYLGLSCPQPVYRWYKGQILPSVDNLLKLSELFHTHMENLIVKDKEDVHTFEGKHMDHNSGLLKRMVTYYSGISGYFRFGLSVQ